MTPRKAKNPKQCPTCGHPHAADKCSAHRKSDGRQCGNDPMHGQSVCRMHGGSTKRSKAKAARVIAQVELVAAVKTLGARRDIDPTEALLEEIQWTAGHVGWLRDQVQELSPHELTWGITKEKSGGDDRGTTEEAKPSIYYVMYTQERKHLLAAITAAKAIDIDERQIRLAERQGQLLWQAMTAFQQSLLAAVLQLLVNQGKAADLVRAQWADLVTQTAPQAMRAIGGTQ